MACLPLVSFLGQNHVLPVAFNLVYFKCKLLVLFVFPLSKL